MKLKVINTDNSGQMKFADGEILSIDREVMERLIRGDLVKRGENAGTREHGEQNIISYVRSLRGKGNVG